MEGGFAPARHLPARALQWQVGRSLPGEAGGKDVPHRNPLIIKVRIGGKDCNVKTNTNMHRYE
jgi:hypothetical protein